MVLKRLLKRQILAQARKLQDRQQYKEALRLYEQARQLE